MEENEQGTKKPQNEDEVLNPDDFDEGNPEAGDDKPGEDKPKKKEPESEDGQADDAERKRRAEFARRRREREAQERAERERQEREAQIRREAAEQEALGLITKNPYTGKPIKDAKDLEVYKIQKAIDDRGGDPIADLPEEIAERNRRAEAERTKAAEDERKQGETLKAQIEELRKAHPEVNTAKLADDPDFMEIANEKQGRWSLLEVYEETQRRRKAKPDPQVDEAANAAARKAKQPSASGNGSNQADKPKTFKNYEEFTAYWNKKYS